VQREIWNGLGAVRVFHAACEIGFVTERQRIDPTMLTRTKLTTDGQFDSPSVNGASPAAMQYAYAVVHVRVC
jgi:hypothetical protein